MKNGARTYVSWAVLALIIAAPLLSLGLVAAPMGGEGMSGCPFMQDEAVVCDMSVLDHLEHWQGAFAAAPAQAILIFGFIAAIVAAFWLTSRLYTYSPPRQTHARIPTLVQQLFAQGLLNSKAY